MGLDNPRPEGILPLRSLAFPRSAYPESLEPIAQLMSTASPGRGIKPVDKSAYTSLANFGARNAPDLSVLGRKSAQPTSFLDRKNAPDETENAASPFGGTSKRSFHSPFVTRETVKSPFVDQAAASHYRRAKSPRLVDDANPRRGMGTASIQAGLPSPSLKDGERARETFLHPISPDNTTLLSRSFNGSLPTAEQLLSKRMTPAQMRVVRRQAEMRARASSQNAQQIMNANQEAHRRQRSSLQSQMAAKQQAPASNWEPGSRMESSTNFQQKNETPATSDSDVCTMFMHYTISEDRSGSQDVVISQRLAALTKKNRFKPFIHDAETEAAAVLFTPEEEREASWIDSIIPLSKRKAVDDFAKATESYSIKTPGTRTDYPSLSSFGRQLPSVQMDPIVCSKCENNWHGMNDPLICPDCGEFTSRRRGDGSKDHASGTLRNPFNPDFLPPKPLSRSDRDDQDYHMQLMRLEQQNKKRLMMARVEDQLREMISSDTAIHDPGNHVLKGHQMPTSIILDQQSQNTLTKARQEQDQLGRNGSSDTAMYDLKNGPLQDYNMQVMLLEQQNKRRLMMARQEQDQTKEWELGTRQTQLRSKPRNTDNAYNRPSSGRAFNTPADADLSAEFGEMQPNTLQQATNDAASQLRQSLLRPPSAYDLTPHPSDRMPWPSDPIEPSQSRSWIEGIPSARPEVQSVGDPDSKAELTRAEEIEYRHQRHPPGGRKLPVHEQWLESERSIKSEAARAVDQLDVQLKDIANQSGFIGRHADADSRQGSTQAPASGMNMDWSEWDRIFSRNWDS